MKRTIKSIGGRELTVEAREWKKADQHRIYFAVFTSPNERKPGQACWDVNQKKWVGVYKEVGEVIKERITGAFGDIM
ncbi:MAG: hypothetical protein KatS3mg051_1206 [Anaerolineae bacterium]|nr:MAG: hypothetical protein KatS3mg051_1206 [Anaerolineae bacterium]